MAVFSTLRAFHRGIQSLKTPLTRPLFSSIPKSSDTAGCVRRMSDHRSMQLLPSTFDYVLWKDQLHLFFMMGLIPIALVVSYCNVFIGKADLTDTPEGYEPKHWEYHNHPISRCLSRYVFWKPQAVYERHLHAINIQNERIKLRRLEAKVRDLMKNRNDYEGWYFIPINEGKVRTQYEEKRSLYENSGTQG